MTIDPETKWVHPTNPEHNTGLLHPKKCSIAIIKQMSYHHHCHSCWKPRNSWHFCYVRPRWSSRRLVGMCQWEVWKTRRLYMRKWQLRQRCLLWLIKPVQETMSWWNVPSTRQQTTSETVTCQKLTNKKKLDKDCSPHAHTDTHTPYWATGTTERLSLWWQSNWSSSDSKQQQKSPRNDQKNHMRQQNTKKTPAIMHFTCTAIGRLRYFVWNGRTTNTDEGIESWRGVVLD